MNDSEVTVVYPAVPWNKGKLIGQKPPLKLREIWALRTRLELAGKTKELALFNLAIDRKLRGCDLVQLRVNDVARGGEVLTRTSVIQQKTHEPVRFELTDPTRVAIAAWIAKAGLTSGSYLFPSRQHASLHLSVRQYARIAKRWVGLIGGNPQEYGTHSLRRTKATLIYRRTKNLRAVQLLLGHRKLDLRAQSDTLASRWTTRWRWQNATSADRPVPVSVPSGRGADRPCAARRAG